MKKKTNEEKMVRLNITLEPQDDKLLRELSEATGRSIASLLRELIDTNTEEIKKATKRATQRKGTFK